MLQTWMRCGHICGRKDLILAFHGTRPGVNAISTCSIRMATSCRSSGCVWCGADERASPDCAWITAYSAITTRLLTNWRLRLQAHAHARALRFHNSRLESY